MIMKRQIIVNRKFQLNMAASFAGLSAATMTVIIIVLSSILIINNKKLGEINSNQQTLSATQKEVFKTLVVLSAPENFGKLHLSLEKIRQDNDSTKQLFDANINKIHGITHRNIYIIILLTASAMIQSALVFYLMLKRSHRISGPLFLMNRYINEMKKGKYPEIRALRKNDDFRELFDNFRELAEKLRRGEDG